MIGEFFYFDMSEFEVLDKDFSTVILNIEKEGNVAVGKIAEDIRADIQANLVLGRSFDGSQITPLKPSTIKRKGFNAVFVDSGELQKSVKKIKINKSEWEIFIADIRAKIMAWLQAGKKPLAGKRRAFGISKRAIDHVQRRLMEMKITFPH